MKTPDGALTEGRSLGVFGSGLMIKLGSLVSTGTRGGLEGVQCGQLGLCRPVEFVSLGCGCASEIHKGVLPRCVAAAPLCHSSASARKEQCLSGAV